MPTKKPKVPIPVKKPVWPWVALAIILGAGAYFIVYYFLPGTFETLTTVLRRPSKSVGGHLKTITHHSSLSRIMVDQEVKLSAPTLEPAAARSGVERYDITYTSQDPRTGREVLVTGRLYLPTAAKDLPLLAFAPGTTGVGKQCAPTLETARGKNWGQYDRQLTFYAGQGFAVAMTDYDGRQPQDVIHHYFIGEYEGRVLLDLIRSTKKFKDADRGIVSPIGKSIFAAGFSQGGHAALFADQIRRSYAPDVTLTGVIGVAAATDLIKTFTDTMNGARTIWLPIYLFAAYADYYNLAMPPQTLLKDPFAATAISDAKRYCIDEAEQAATGRWGNPSTNQPLVYQDGVIASLKSRTFLSAYPEIAGLLQANRAGDYPSETPLLLITGDKDVTVFPSSQRELVSRWCQSSSAVAQLVEIPALTHYNVIPGARSKIIEWMINLSSNGAPPNECGRYRS